MCSIIFWVVAVADLAERAGLWRIQPWIICCTCMGSRSLQPRMAPMAILLKAAEAQGAPTPESMTASLDCNLDLSLCIPLEKSGSKTFFQVADSVQKVLCAVQGKEVAAAADASTEDTGALGDGCEAQEGRRADRGADDPGAEPAGGARRQGRHGRRAAQRGPAAHPTAPC